MALCIGNLTKHVNAYCGHNARRLYPTRGSRYITENGLRTLKIYGVAVSDDPNPNPTSLVQLTLSRPFPKLQIFEYFSPLPVINRYKMKFSTMGNKLYYLLCSVIQIIR